MYKEFLIKLIICLITTKFSFAEVVDINNEQIIELSQSNVPIVDVERIRSSFKPVLFQIVFC